jgi:hypothetical protein
MFLSRSRAAFALQQTGLAHDAFARSTARSS